MNMITAFVSCEVNMSNFSFNMLCRIYTLQVTK